MHLIKRGLPYQGAIAKGRIKKKSKKVHIITDEQREFQKNKRFVESVKFSIITPLYNTPEKYLVELLESLENRPIRIGNCALLMVATQSMVM